MLLVLQNRNVEWIRVLVICFVLGALCIQGLENLPKKANS